MRLDTPDAAHLASMMAGFATATREEKVRLAESALDAGGEPARRQVGQWITTLIPAASLVPANHQDLHPFVEDAFRFVFSRLSSRRLATKLVEQMELPPDTTPETRLLLLISKMPGLQKLGQVLARSRRFSPALRNALSELENGMADVGPEEILAIIHSQLGGRLEHYQVEIEPAIFKEGSANAIVRFTWATPGKERERGVFKVVKPYVGSYFAEDMTLFQKLSEYLSAHERGYAFAVRDLREMMTEVRTLLEHELDLPLEQRTLQEAHTGYRASIGIHVPRVIAPLSTQCITAMTEEAGVKVTEACPRSPVRRAQIARQLIEALVAVPLFSRRDSALFHADPHAGNLLYDEPNRELVVIDWALSGRLSLPLRRQVVMLVLMMSMRNPAGVGDAIRALRTGDPEDADRDSAVIERRLNRFFGGFAAGYSPGALDAMRLLDEIALEGVRFPAPIFLFRKVLFTLDAVLRDVAGEDVRIDHVITREYLARGLASFGMLLSPLTLKDLAAIQWNAFLLPARRWGHKLLGPALYS